MTLPLSHTDPAIQVADTDIDEFTYDIITPSQEIHRLEPVWHLMATNLAATGDVHPEKAWDAAMDREFDESDCTRVVTIRHASGRLAGTYSLTMDSQEGMPILHHFERELTLMRRKYRLLNGWRFAMSPFYRSGRLRQRSMTYFKQLVAHYQADAFVIYYNERLEGYYHRLFTGRVLGSKAISLDGHSDVRVNVMLCETQDNLPNPAHIHKGIDDVCPMVIR